MVGGQDRVGKRGPQGRGALDDPGEAEQLVLDLVEAAGTAGLPNARLSAEDLHAVHQVTRG